MKDYIERHALYEMLAKLTRKNAKTIKMWFFRKEKDIKNHEDFAFYLNLCSQHKTKKK